MQPPEGSVGMMQIDCEIFDTQLIHIRKSVFPQPPSNTFHPTYSNRTADSTHQQYDSNQTADSTQQYHSNQTADITHQQYGSNQTASTNHSNMQAKEEELKSQSRGSTSAHQRKQRLKRHR